MTLLIVFVIFTVIVAIGMMLATLADRRTNVRLNTAARPRGAAINRNPNGLLGLVSFIIPLAGIIVAAIFLTRDNQHDRETGKLCLTCAVLAIFIGFGVLMVAWTWIYRLQT